MQVRVYEDRAWKDIDGILQNLALEDHSDADCILIAVLSHGELGILYASDHAYKPDKLWAPFNSEACPSLAGKPKLFFIQVSNYNLKGHYGLTPISKVKSNAEFECLENMLNNTKCNSVIFQSKDKKPFSI